MNENKITLSENDFKNLEKIIYNLRLKNQSNKKYKYLNLTRIETELKLMPIWLSWVKSGKLGGRAVGPRTIEIYDYYLKLYLKTLPEDYSIPIISIENFRFVLGEIPVQKYSTRRNIYDAIKSVTKFLIEQEEFSKEDREKLSELKPRRFLPAKRPCINEEQLNQVIRYIDCFENLTRYSKLLKRTLVLFIANTGLRSSEVADLILDDVDLKERTVFVRCGKGRKSRRVGINKSLVQVLEEFLKERKKKFANQRSFFLTTTGTPTDKNSIHQIIERISQNFDFHFTPHALRRAFVTINVAKGRQLVFLQIACGHADITTTRSYCQTSEDEVLEAMRDW